MTIFFSILILITILIFIWLPYLPKSHKTTSDVDLRKETNISLFNERLEYLEKNLSDNIITLSEFTRMKNELEVNLLQDVSQGSDHIKSSKENKKNIIIPMAISCIVVITSIYGYYKFGNYKVAINPELAKVNTSISNNMQQSQAIKMYEQRKNLTMQDPSNSESWFQFGYSAIEAGHYDEAVEAFDHVTKLLNAEFAEILGPKATALYYKNNSNITPEVKAIIDRALQLDPLDPATLELIARDAFQRGDFSSSIKALETILSSTKLEPQVREAFTKNLEMIKSHSSIDVQNSQQITTIEPIISVEVDIDPSIKDVISPTDIVVVYVRPIGSKMPITMEKTTVSKLPTSLILDGKNHLGMNDIFLSQLQDAEIIVIISKSGSIMANSGDIRDSITMKISDGSAKIIAKNKIN